MIEHRLQHRGKTLVLLDEIRELVKDDDCILIGEISEDGLPVLSNARNPRMASAAVSMNCWSWSALVFCFA
nr:hypothetical protein [Halarchaeum acidiphilum]